MIDRAYLLLALAVSFGLAISQFASAQEIVETIDCTAEENLANEACLNLPEGNQPVTNLGPILAPVLGLAAIAGLSGGGSDGVSTPSTPSTPSTN